MARATIKRTREKASASRGGACGTPGSTRAPTGVPGGGSEHGHDRATLRGQDHPLRGHPPDRSGGHVREHNQGSAVELLRPIKRSQTGQDRPRAPFSHVQGQYVQPIRLRMRLHLRDASDADLKFRDPGKFGPL